MKEKEDAPAEEVKSQAASAAPVDPEAEVKETPTELPAEPTRELDAVNEERVAINEEKAMH